MKINGEQLLVYGASVLILLMAWTIFGQAALIETLTCRVNRLEVILYSGTPQPDCKQEEPRQ